jgi:hypothetical protein
MRQIEEEMCAAIAQRRNWKKDNTEVTFKDYVIRVYLFGNMICKYNVISEEIVLDTCGWDTRTTNSRMRAIRKLLHLEKRSAA